MSAAPPELDARRLLVALSEAEVEFILVGGFAVGAHGHPRATKDVDLLPAPDQQNLERLAALLREIDYEIMGVDDFDPDEVVHPDLDGLRRGGSWVLLTRFGRLDVLQHLEPDLDYATLKQGAIKAEVFGVEVRFCGYDDLLAMKRAAGRPVDLADIEQLEALRSG